MLSSIKLLTNDGKLRSTWSGLMRRLQVVVETTRATNNTGANMVKGNVVRISGNRQVALADASAAGTAAAVGVLEEDIADGESGIMRTDNRAYVLFEDGLEATLSAGDYAYVSAATAGRATNAAPGNDYIIGIVVDTTGYADGVNNYAWVQMDHCCPDVLAVGA